MANINIRFPRKSGAWFTANATLILLDGQIVFQQGSTLFKVGDGTTQLQNLLFYNSVSTLAQVLLAGNTVPGGATIITPNFTIDTGGVGSVYGLAHVHGSTHLTSYIDTGVGAGAWFGTKSAHDFFIFTGDGSPQAIFRLGGNFALPLQTANKLATFDADKNVVSGNMSEQDIVDALALKLDASAYVQYFLGVFVSLAALQSAYPSSSVGYYAQVDPGSGTSLQTYSWDAQEGWVLSSSDGTGANNTDQLPEGASNLYFTAQRVRDAILTGLSTATNAVILASDSVVIAFGKLQAQVSSILSSLNTHIADTANPHSVTKSQVGLGNVANVDTTPGSITFMFDGLGGVIAVGSHATATANCKGTITGWEVIETSDTPVSSTIVFDVWKDTFANYPPTVADTIFVTKPNLTAQTKNSATGLSIAFNSLDIFKGRVDSNNTAVKARLTLFYTKTA